MKKFFWLTICLVIIIFMALYVIWKIQESPQKEIPSPAKAIFSAIDSRGKEIVLEQKPQRIVSLAPSNTEILFALGLDKEIVGITDYCDYPPEKVASKEKIGGFATPNLEKIISLNPDVVFTTSGVQKQAIERLEELDIKVYVLEAETVEDLLAQIKNLGKLTGKSQEAQDLTVILDKRVRVVQEKTSNLPDDQRPKVFLEIWHDPLWTAPTRTLIYQIIELAGGRHVVSIEGDWNQITTVDPESVIDANPDVIFLAFTGSDPEAVYRLAGWGAVSAVKNRKVFQIDPNIISRPGPRIIDALEQIAKILYPDLF
ncbi:MAG: cobalamin-binding protein [Candidatus Doudnabacteria bacterium]